MRRTVLTFGLIAGAVLSVMMLLTLPFQDAIGFEKGAIIGYTTMVLAFLMIFFGVKSYRDNVVGGNLTFGRAFRVGMLILAVASACYVATWQVIYYRLAPDFVDKYTAHSIERVRNSGASEAEIAAVVAKMAKYREWYRNPLVNIAVTLLEPLPVGLLFTLIAAGALTRKRKETGAAMAPAEAS